jgi:hypothetical protein
MLDGKFRSEDKQRLHCQALHTNAPNSIAFEPDYPYAILVETMSVNHTVQRRALARPLERFVSPTSRNLDLGREKYRLPNLR